MDYRLDDELDREEDVGWGCVSDHDESSLYECRVCGALECPGVPIVDGLCQACEHDRNVAWEVRGWAEARLEEMKREAER